MRVKTQLHADQRKESNAAALLLPGMSLNATIFPDFGLPTITPDLSGIDLAETGVTPELVRDGFEVFVRVIENELRASPSWNEARRIVVAHSFGGMLALRWLLGNSGRERPVIDGLVLIASTAGPMYKRVQLQVPNPWDLNWRVDCGWLVPIWNQLSVTRTVKRFLCDGRLGADPVDFGSLNIKSDQELGIAGWRNTDWRAMRAFRYVMDGFDVRERLGEITVPTVVLHGTNDSLFDIDDARLLSSKLPNAELRLIKGAGHSLPITHGNEVVRAVKDLAVS
jgi:pimeloyl-ACP methyl ester carboxylesterase